MVTIRKGAPVAPIAGDQVVADLTELLTLARAEVISDNGYIVIVKPKRPLAFEAWEFGGARLDETIRRALVWARHNSQ